MSKKLKLRTDDIPLDDSPTPIDHPPPTDKQSPPKKLKLRIDNKPLDVNPTPAYKRPPIDERPPIDKQPPIDKRPPTDDEAPTDDEPPTDDEALIHDGLLEATDDEPPDDDEPLTEYHWQFRGFAGDYFKIWIVNILLSFVTFGVFSAWAKVRSKRYFYGNTTLDGYAFDYDANPLSILISRIIVATAVLVCAIILGGNASIALLCFLLPAALVRSLVFDAHYSSYRGVRFHFNKPYIGMYWTLAPALLCILPLILVSFYTLSPDIDDAQRITGRSIISILLVLLLCTLPIIWSGYYHLKTVKHAWGGAPLGERSPPFLKFCAPLLFLIPPATAAVFVLIRAPAATPPATLLFLSAAVFYPVVFLVAATLLHLHWRSVRVLGGAIQCNFSVTGYCLKILLVNFIAVTLSLGLLYPWAKVRRVRFLAEHTLLFVPASAIDSVIKGHHADEDAVGEELDANEDAELDS